MDKKQNNKMHRKRNQKKISQIQRAHRMKKMKEENYTQNVHSHHRAHTAKHTLLDWERMHRQSSQFSFWLVCSRLTLCAEDKSIYSGDELSPIGGVKHSDGMHGSNEYGANHEQWRAAKLNIANMYSNWEYCRIRWWFNISALELKIADKNATRKRHLVEIV